MPYYNTIPIKDPKLAEKRAKNVNQDELILYMFKKNRKLSPSQAYRRLYEAFPLTSVRRSITDLTRSGKLVKTSIRVTGIYGDLEHVWEIADPQMKLFQ